MPVYEQFTTADGITRRRVFSIFGGPEEHAMAKDPVTEHLKRSIRETPSWINSMHDPIGRLRQECDDRIARGASSDYDEALDFLMVHNSVLYNKAMRQIEKESGAMSTVTTIPIPKNDPTAAHIRATIASGYPLRIPAGYKPGDSPHDPIGALRSSAQNIVDRGIARNLQDALDHLRATDPTGYGTAAAHLRAVEGADKQFSEDPEDKLVRRARKLAVERKITFNAAVDALKIEEPLMFGAAMAARELRDENKVAGVVSTHALEAKLSVNDEMQTAILEAVAGGHAPTKLEALAYVRQNRPELFERWQTARYAT